MKNQKNEKTPLIVFSSTLAVLVVAALVCGAIFAGASNEQNDLSLEATDSGVVYVQFDKEPTEEEISAVLEEYDVWSKRTNPDNSKSDKAEVDVDAIEYVEKVKIDGVTYLQFDKGTTKEQINEVIQKYVKSGMAVDYHEGKYILTSEEEIRANRFKYDISKYIETDNPTGIYVPVAGLDFNIDIRTMLKNRWDNIASIHKFSGQERSAARDSAYYSIVDFCGDRDAFVGYESEKVYNHDGTAKSIVDYYKAEDYKASYDPIARRELNFERTVWFNREHQLLGAPGLLYGSTASQVIDSTNGLCYVKDYGTYLGRNAVRIVGDTSKFPDYRENTGMYTYEFVFDIETEAVMAFIAYGENGDIISYRIITEFSTDDSIEVPLYPNVNKN